MANDARGKRGRDLLVEGCKGILEGTTHLLNAYDDSEVRKIVAQCQESRQLIEQLQGAMDLQSILQVMKPTCQALVDLTALSTRRVDELLSQALQKRLQVAIADVTSSSSLLVSSCKAVAQNGANEQVVHVRYLILIRLIVIVTEIETVVQIRDWVEPSYADVIGQLAINRHDVVKQLGEIMLLAQEGKSEELLSLLEAFEFTSDMLVT